MVLTADAYAVGYRAAMSERELMEAAVLLGDCAVRLDQDHDTGGIGELVREVRRRYDALGDVTGEAAGTVAVGRFLAAVFELRWCVDVVEELNSGWDYGYDGLPLDGMADEDEDGVSRGYARAVVRAGRAALGVDSADPLVPLHLGHALAWAGDAAKAEKAYRETLIRDPHDEVAQNCLEAMGEEAGDDRSGSPERGYAFALLCVEGRISNSEWRGGGWVHRSLASARAAADEMMRSSVGDLDRDELDDHMRLRLEVHRPGMVEQHHELLAWVPKEPVGGPFVIDWVGLAGLPELAGPVPAGRVLRVDGRECFPR